MSKSTAELFAKQGPSPFLCAFSRRSSGNMSLSYGATGRALENRRDFLSPLGIDYRDLVCAKQAHSSNARYVKIDDKGKGAFTYETAVEDCDALVTEEKSLPLSVFTADCLPVFLYDFKTPAIGIIHAGWRGSKAGITAKTVELMKEKFNTDGKDIIAGFGPAIRACCYEVAGDFRDLFPGKISKKEDRFFLDLVSVNKEELLKAGVRRENIFDPKACTYCDRNDFFSYRREAHNVGRMLSVIMLKDA